MDTAVLISLPVIAIFGFLGFRDGVIKRLVEIAGVIVTLILTARFATSVNPWVIDHIGVAEGPALLITWAGLFLAGILLSRLLASMLSKVIRLTILGWVDKAGGALVGVLIGTLVSSVILVAISQVPGGQAVQQSYDKAPIGRFIFYAAPVVYRSAMGLVGQRADEIWDRVFNDVKDQAEEKAAEAVDKAKDAAAEALKD